MGRYKHNKKNKIKISDKYSGNNINDNTINNSNSISSTNSVDINKTTLLQLQSAVEQLGKSELEFIDNVVGDKLNIYKEYLLDLKTINIGNTKNFRKLFSKMGLIIGYSAYDIDSLVKEIRHRNSDFQNKYGKDITVIDNISKSLKYYEHTCTNLVWEINKHIEEIREQEKREVVKESSNTMKIMFKKIRAEYMELLELLNSALVVG